MGRDRGWGWCREGHTSGKEHGKQANYLVWHHDQRKKTSQTKIQQIASMSQQKC